MSEIWSFVSGIIFGAVMAIVIIWAVRLYFGNVWDD